MKNLLLLLISITVFLSTTIVWAQEYEEVSYEELVSRLNKKKNSFSKSQNNSLLDEIMIHAGLGMVASSINFDHAGLSNQRQLTGFQLTLGIDLFSPQWIAEGAIRNFNAQSEFTEVKSFREMDLKLKYQALINTETFGYFIGTGITTRYLRTQSINTETNESTPASLLFGGIYSPISKYLNAGIEISYRTSMLNYSYDRSSFDFLIKMDTNF